MRLSIFTFIYLLFTACTVGKKTPDETVNSFLNSYIQQPDFRKCDSSYLSPELIHLISLAKDHENASAKSLKAIGSTDKPELIEGDILTSIYEGPTMFKISKSTVENTKATVRVFFTNDKMKPDISWVDDVLLEKIGNNWKIIDIEYHGRVRAPKSLKATLMDFIQIESVEVGADKDEHGCISSAGYQWSSLLKTCIRPFELPFQLSNAQQTSNAGLYFTSDSSQVEVFCAEGSTVLNKSSEGYANNSGKVTLNKSGEKWFLLFGHMKYTN